ncbi:rhodanese-related sulfurtransferase [Quisquiliibacterium transsilvanicum]|uniref:Rhodanese-related sulfurtransferase n=1 Tax=Quisquiliibacterium transsilvanicum TaxID=1549638 RepID=A0A7W8M9J1_9BURK|nr:rhodanese-related sulfurtransferase [Quisquiliibacterium transsilvanicum]
MRTALLERREIALLDVREEAPFAEAHPLFAANLPLSRIEPEAWARIPRRDTSIVVYDDGVGLAPRAALRLAELGYTDVGLLEGGLAGWRDAGGELFRDVNVPSKAFGELVESKRHTPSLSAQEVKALLDSKADVVVLDARRFDEYNTMSIPGGISVPGAELALRVRALAPDPSTRVIVNCAGRTRSIIGTQSLVNFGIPNPVAALRNGTIGWTLAGQSLEHGQARRFDPAAGAQRDDAAARARAVADRAGVGRATRASLDAWRRDADRTTCLFDVRTPEEFAAGHLPGSASAPGGQLVQETDHSVPVRGARIVLVDDDGVRAHMTASWLAQMGWEVHVLDGLAAGDFSETGKPAAALPPSPATATVSPARLAEWLGLAASSGASVDGTAPPPRQVVILDLAASATHVRAHLPGAWFALRSQLPEALAAIHSAQPAPARYVLASPDGVLARFAAADLARLVPPESIHVLEGGTDAWSAAGLPMESGEQRLASPRIDRYRRPYEGTDNPVEAMQGYLDWEFGLVEQLGRDGTHGFFVI